MPNGELITNEEWRFYALRGLQETMENRIRRGIPFKPTVPRPPKPTPPRKPKAERSKIGNGPSRFGKGRKLRTANRLRRSK
jgi:hypothetical protein